MFSIIDSKSLEYAKKPDELSEKTKLDDFSVNLRPDRKNYFKPTNTMGNNTIYIQIYNTILAEYCEKSYNAIYRWLKNTIRIPLRYLYLNEQNIHMTCINAIIIVLPVTYCISNGVSFV